MSKLTTSVGKVIGSLKKLILYYIDSCQLSSNSDFVKIVKPLFEFEAFSVLCKVFYDIWHFNHFDSCQMSSKVWLCQHREERFFILKHFVSLVRDLKRYWGHCQAIWRKNYFDSCHQSILTFNSSVKLTLFKIYPLVEVFLFRPKKSTGKTPTQSFSDKIGPFLNS